MDELGEMKYSINIREIKSSFIIKRVFSFLNDKQKLNMIIYNKELQNNFELDIEDYIKISGKYKINGKNGKGSVYSLNTFKLIFEGEYINGKRNGKGKEYFDNVKLKSKFAEVQLFRHLKFKRLYIDDKRNGKGKEYFDNDKLKSKINKVPPFRRLKFERKYINDKRNRKGKESDNELRFKIKFIDEKKMKKEKNILMIVY